MKPITYDPAKRLATLLERGLDFEDAAEVFAGDTALIPDTRFDYGEARTICYGFLKGRAVVIVYVERDGGRHIISMRKANEREQKKFHIRD